MGAVAQRQGCLSPSGSPWPFQKVGFRRGRAGQRARGQDISYGHHSFHCSFSSFIRANGHWQAGLEIHRVFRKVQYFFFHSMCDITLFHTSVKRRKINKLPCWLQGSSFSSYFLLCFDFFTAISTLKTYGGIALGRTHLTSPQETTCLSSSTQWECYSVALSCFPNDVFLELSRGCVDGISSRSLPNRGTGWFPWMSGTVAS